MKKLLIILFLLFSFSGISQVVRIPIGKVSTGSGDVKLTLINRYQRYNPNPKSKADTYDDAIDSPKSVNYSRDGKKFYVQSLEGYTTAVYDASTKKIIKKITHSFDVKNQYLFKDGEITAFNYKYSIDRKDYNYFSGKPVESCLSHEGKFLWVTYYRRDFDSSAECPSAVAIINTESDEIVRVMPTGPLPKMIACSPNNKNITVTHWGDNTLGVINIDSENPMDFYYQKHCIVDYQMELNFGGKSVNRDNNCGYCLRGTVFTPDGKYLLVGKMGGTGGVAVFNAMNFQLLGTVKGMKANIRHLIINGDNLYLSANSPGFVQKCNWKDFIKSRVENEENDIHFKEFESVYVGTGARTIVTTSDGKYLFAAVNNGSKIVAVRTTDMKVVAEIPADSYPVGMDISSNDQELIVTSQGKTAGGGNSVMIFKIDLKN